MNISRNGVIRLLIIAAVAIITIAVSAYLYGTFRAERATSQPRPISKSSGNLVTIPVSTSVPSIPSNAIKLPRQVQDADRRISLSIVLKYDVAGDEEFLKSSNLPKVLSLLTAEECKRFGPSQQTRDAVLAYLEQHGFVLEQSSDCREMDVQGTRGEAEQAFHVQINDYQICDRSLFVFCLANRTFFANDTDPAIAPPIATYIGAISGLNSLAHPEPI